MHIPSDDKKIKNFYKKDPWKLNFIDKMLIFSNISSSFVKNRTIFKNFTLASFSIDTGAKIYADRVDTLYDFVFGFFEGLNSINVENTKKKIFPANFTKKISENILLLTTKEKNPSKKNMLFNFVEKICTLLSTPFLKNFFLKKDFFKIDKTKTFRFALKFHRKKFQREKYNEFLIAKKLNLAYFKFIDYQKNLQILDSKKRYHFKILRKNTRFFNSELFVLKKITFIKDFQKESIEEYFPIKFTKKFIFQTKKKNQKNKFGLEKKNKKPNKRSKTLKDDILFQSNLIPNYFENFFFIFSSKKQNKIHKNNLKLEFLFQKFLFLPKCFLQKKKLKEEDHSLLLKTPTTCGKAVPFKKKIQSGVKKALSFKADENNLLRKNFKKFNTKIIIQLFIYFLKLFLDKEKDRVTFDLEFSSLNKIDQKCHFVITNSHISYQKVILNIEATYSPKKKFLNFLICFLHSALDRRQIFVGNCRLNSFFVFTHSKMGI